MCGRYVLDNEGIIAFEKFARSEEAAGLIRPRFNIAPTQQAPVIVKAEDGGTPLLRMMYWGLIPGWARDASMAAKMINARGETLAEKPSFRGPFASSRCLVPASGFYEWRKDGTRKTPFYISRRDSPAFAMAGLFSHWRSPEGESRDTFTIITTEANAALAGLHERMPVLLEPGDWLRWLGAEPAPKEELQALLRPCEPELLGLREVSPRVNSPREDDAALLAPVGLGL
ncbi:SOS response-associated peptidase [bacterium]|nr:SOS response-associated peptidase [bacterium]